MEKSQRFFFPANDCTMALVRAQMKQKFLHGLGFCDFNTGAIIDPTEIVGKVIQESKTTE